VFFAGLPALRAQQHKSGLEYKIKAAFLYNFTRFVNWPPKAFPSPNEPFVIGIIGKDPFGTYIDEIIKGEKVGERPIQVKRCQDIKDVTGCQILYINIPEQSRVKEIIAKTDQDNTLTVSDVNGFISCGGHFFFFKENNKVRIEINMEATKKSQLEISSKLLSIAKIVTEKEL
jgi:hypothetical protein